ncbi:uncharacterized protein LOC133825132 [Humulus lupulus]|uniref:uncharacterized protein LOC133825132 n=1 Tax=Humulus lupulus TaxID=3486 RepID=UPI002B410134|nr:uncharacterized protein LOC133825132 [Humulus lupulus]
MDFVVGLPRNTKQRDSVLVIVDRLTKSAHFLPVRTVYNVEQYAKLYMVEIVRLHGVLKTIVFDRGFVFTSKYLRTKTSFSFVFVDTYFRPFAFLLSRRYGKESTVTGGFRGARFWSFTSILHCVQRVRELVIGVVYEISHWQGIPIDFFFVKGPLYVCEYFRSSPKEFGDPDIPWSEASPVEKILDADPTLKMVARLFTVANLNRYNLFVVSDPDVLGTFSSEGRRRL